MDHTLFTYRNLEELRKNTRRKRSIYFHVC